VGDRADKTQAQQHPSFLQFPRGESHQDSKLEASSSSPLPILMRVFSIQSLTGVAAEVTQSSTQTEKAQPAAGKVLRAQTSGEYLLC